MAKPTPHTALEGMGFKFVGSGFNGSSDHIGVARTHHYTKTTNSVGGGVSRPVTHHVLVDEFDRNPGKYNVSYRLTQDGNPYSEGEFDTRRRHRDNMNGGVKDPIAEIIQHHRGVTSELNRKKALPLIDVNRQNIHMLLPGQGQMSSSPMIHLNATGDWPFRDVPKPLDLYVHRRLTGGRHGYPKFEYEGRFPGDDGVDVYHASYQDPEDPDASKYGFTIRHNPDAARPFSYNATQSEVDPSSGESHISRFLDISNMGDPVLNFSHLGAVVERHHNMLRSLGLLKPTPEPSRPAWHFTAGVQKTADEFDDIVSGNGYSGSCSNCGKAVRDIPESSFRDDKLYQLTPEDDAPDPEMHGGPVNLCGSCYVDSDMHEMAHRMPKMFGWHYPGAKIGSCPDCDRQAMDEADEDLLP